MRYHIVVKRHADTVLYADWSVYSAVGNRHVVLTSCSTGHIYSRWPHNIYTESPIGAALSSEKDDDK